MDDGAQQGLPLLQPEEAWRALAYRLMSGRQPRITPEPPLAQILPAQMPADLPVEIPMPNGSRIVGSVLNTGGLERVTIYGDALESPQDVLAFYHQQLVGDGWSELDLDTRRGGGFNDVDHYHQVRGQFCRGERGPAIFVEATRQERAPTSLRITLYTDERNSPCLPRERRGPPPNPIPPLPPPAGARFVLGAGPTTSVRAYTARSASEPGPARQLGGSLGTDHAHSSVEIGTDLDLEELAQHYNRHLEAGGWLPEESERMDRPAGFRLRTAWSTWTFRRERDGRWRGLLIVFQQPDIPNRYIIQVLAESLREP